MKTTTLGPPKSVDVSQIELELAELWRSSAHKDPETGPAVMRTCAQNLVAIVNDPAGADTIEEIFSQLTGEYPSRGIIVIVQASSSDGGLDAWVSARCQLPSPEGKQLCCEQIMLSARGPDAAHEVAPTVLSLFLPDLPTFIWWRDASPFDMPGAHHLLEIVDRVVVNSARFPDPHQGLQQLMAIVHNPHYACALGDFNWERLISWRSMLAQFFDVAAVRPYLDRIDRVRIEYAVTDLATARLRARSLLLAGWLASRLGWKPAPGRSRIERGRGEWQLDAGDHTVAVTIVPVHLPDDIQGRLVSVQLVASGASPAEFEVHRSADRRYLETQCRIEGVATSCHLMQPDEYTEADLVAHQLKVLSHDVIYEQALDTACQLIGLGKSGT